MSVPPRPTGRFPTHSVGFRPVGGGRDETAVAELAARQHGVVGIDQLRRLGFSERSVHRRAQDGRFHRIHQGVYAVGHARLTLHGRLTAAVLACGPGAVLSHRSAAALWGFRRESRRPIDVTAPGRRGRAPSGISAHRHGSLRSRDIAVIEEIPCTGAARTLLDLAGVLSVEGLGRAVARAEILRVLDLREIEDLIASNRGRRGVARLRLVIDEYDWRAEATKGELERRFLELCRRAELPLPGVNVLIDCGASRPLADFVWADSRLIVETDSRQFHGTDSAFEADRKRDQELTLAGWRVIRTTWSQVNDRPEELARTIRLLLSDRAQRRA
jgi:very-short-patch-repair endonuclease